MITNNELVDDEKGSFGPVDPKDNSGGVIVWTGANILKSAKPGFHIFRAIVTVRGSATLFANNETLFNVVP